MILHNFFGKYMNGTKIPSDFPLSRISVPITVHYSTHDKVANAMNSQTTISKLKNVVYVQEISEIDFNHIDFALSVNAPSLVYSKILKQFDNCWFWHTFTIFK